MVLQPIDDTYAQTQPLTTALRNICRDYPAGGIILRELLQNADDAGATEMRFILDEGSYPVHPLIHDELGQYQGPALLAYNNAIFRDEDFESLSKIGDSLKINDGSTTGKFGRGFNSVYNWTDSPSIVSRNRLVILDPHIDWSRNGGRVDDFVKNAGEIEIKNHMAAFQTVIDHVDRPLDGTVIRIPLRTHARACKSEIRTMETTAAEILEVLKSFASDFGDNGLLFMRNVDNLEIGSVGWSIKIQMADSQSLRSHKSKVNDAVKQALKDSKYSFDHCFSASIEYRSAEITKHTTFVIQHIISGGLIDDNLRNWANDQRLIPWVAVAAQLPADSTETGNGTLFTVLPLPIATTQPVHIHGLFSISPDRARLYQLSDGSAQDQTPAKWNDWLFRGPIPIAWTKLLRHFAHMYPLQSAFTRWPRTVEDTNSPLSHALEKVVEIITTESLPLWPTDTGYVAIQDGLLDEGTGSEALRNGLRESCAPIVYVPPHLQQRAERIFFGRILRPQLLCHFLKSSGSHVNRWSIQTKHTILEYLLSDPRFTGYDGLDLFPFEDGVYRSVGERVAFVHRDEAEKSLFRLDGSSTLDLEKLSGAAQQTLRYGCQKSTNHPSIRFRSPKCLEDYCMRTIFKNLTEDQDMVVLDNESTDMVLEVWKWLSTHRINILNKHISLLWLLPLSNGCHRRLKPRKLPSPVYLAPAGEVGHLMWKLDAKSSEKKLPLLKIGQTGLVASSVQILTRRPDDLSEMSIHDASSLKVFLQWLCRTFPTVDNVSEKEKLLIVELITQNLPQSPTTEELSAIIRFLSRIEIFQKVSWKLDGNKTMPVLQWTSLINYHKSIGLVDGLSPSPIPDIDGIQFLDARWPRSSIVLLQKLKLVDCLTSVQVIQDYIIPSWKSKQASIWTSSCKESVAEFILSHFSSLSLNSQEELRAVPMVACTTLTGNAVSRFEISGKLIDPSTPKLVDLCFPDENIFPERHFLRQFNAALKGCGLKTILDEAMVNDRVSCYATAKYPLPVTQRRSERLLSSVCHWTSPSTKEDSAIRHLKWLPAIDRTGNLALKSANECQSQRNQLLVNSHTPILSVPISSDWEERLGWNTTLSCDSLLLQLKFGIQQKSREIVDAVLSYIHQRGLSEQLNNELKSLPCVLVTSGLFFLPSKAFAPSIKFIHGCDGLQPYLANVDQKFWEDHESLLRGLEVTDKPDKADLLNVQMILEQKTDLEASDVEVAIEILRMACIFTDPSFRNQLKVINDAGKFLPIGDINYDDLGHLKAKQVVNLAHPDIPRRTIEKLGILGLRDRVLKGLLEIEDIDDDDEFDQREKVRTRISNTLDRYPVDTTFREYLANADDTIGATKISWLLDTRKEHPRDKLLTTELKRAQGPALLVYNNGVFSDEDFIGLKNVGEGSKISDKKSVGQFGCGSQTMYHWTDTPMILSGKYLLILDPQQHLLPMNQIKQKRKPGVKLKLSKVRENCGDHLVPFEGLWDYTNGLDNYPGTIFRFPLRNVDAKSKLRTSQRNLDSDEVCRLLNHYFDEARISLLFLRRIKSIDFSIYGEPELGWSITRKPPLDEDAKSFSELVICTFVQNKPCGIPTIGKDKWWVTIGDLNPATNSDEHNSRRVKKNAECGFAALITTTFESFDVNVPPSAVESRMFSVLPLPLPLYSDLPVHVHATFDLSGDRQSIAIDEYGAKTQKSKWNRHLLQEALPKLYLLFLDDIGAYNQEIVFRYWPQEKPPKRSCADLLCEAFWKELPSSSQRLFPKFRPAADRTKRRAAELFTIHQAVFDVLPQLQSEVLAPLLVSLDVNLVRNIPMEVSRHLKEIPGLKLVSGPVLRELLKSDRGRDSLQKQMAMSAVVFNTLFSQMSQDGKFEDMDGCHILPLADNTLATLRLVNAGDTSVSKYYAASENELKLFKFASKKLVAPGIPDGLKLILNNGKFNFEKFQLCHVKELLELRMESKTPDPEADRWLLDFWEFWNGHINSDVPSTSVVNSGYKIFRAKRNGLDLYASPVEFTTFPAVVDPSIIEHQQLCDAIPGLYRFKPSLMPKSVSDDEESFHKRSSFYKLIRALRMLAGNVAIGTFVTNNLEASHIKIFRDLILFHISRDILSHNSTPGNYTSFSSDLKSIPVWPNLNTSSTEKCISANEALVFANDQLLVPWIKEIHRFVTPAFASDYHNQQCLTKLGVKSLTTEILLKDYVLPLPLTLCDNHWQYLQPLVNAISQFATTSDSSNPILLVLKGAKIAADQSRNITAACELYDHDDSLFISAFRHERERRFLHDSLTQYRIFWLKVGLRHREGNFISPEDFLQCAKVMEHRLNGTTRSADPYIYEDCQNVLSPLLASTPHIQRCTTLDWAAISAKKIFLPRTVFNAELEYRRNGMAFVAAEGKALCLSEIISHDHVAISWSQTPFPIYQPSTETLNMVPGKGNPKVDMVWRHVCHMKQVAQHLKSHQVKDFLDDLYLAYDYLRDNLDESTANFNLEDRAIWLNVDVKEQMNLTLADIRLSWYGTEHLVLCSSCDSDKAKAVRPTLMRYEKLLRALGCKSIIYPTVPRPEVHPGYSTPASLRQLRRDGTMLDITYSTGGRILQAHRVVLAAVSKKCAAQFSGPLQIEDTISYDEDDDPENFLSYHTLSSMINYAYEDEIDWKAMEVSDSDNVEERAVKFHMLLDLYQGADCWFMDKLMSLVVDKILLTGGQFMNIATASAFRDRAKQVRATPVQKLLDEFIKLNDEAC